MPANIELSVLEYPSMIFRNPISDSQQPRCKQRGIKLATLQSSGVCDPRGIRQMPASQSLGSLLAGINGRKLYISTETNQSYQSISQEGKDHE